MKRLVIGAWALLFVLAFAAQATAQGDPKDQDQVTMDDLVRELEDQRDQRSALRDKIRKVESEIKLEQELIETAKTKAEADRVKELEGLEGEALAQKKAEQEAARPAAEKVQADRVAALEAKKTELELLNASLKERDTNIKATQKKLVRIERSLQLELQASRELRCMTALCWGDGGTQYAVEPVVDLPIGLAFSVGGGALTSYLNSNKLSVEFNAGLRFWFWHDRLSFMIFFSKPVLESTDRIKLDGSPFEHPTASVHRPYPNIGFGFLGDLLQIGFAYDVLVNGDSATDRDPRYRANQVLSHSLTITVGFATVLTARTAFAEAKLNDNEKAEP